MNRKRVTRLIIFSALLSVFFIAAIILSEDKYITHEVKKGESVSLLCIEIYGYYSNELGAAFAADNPKVKNINLIYVGQTLRFKKPVAEEVAAKQETIKEKDIAKVKPEVFVKKVDATQGVVTYVEGTAHLTKKDSSKSEKLNVNVVVYPGDTIKTGKDGRVEMIINRESVVRMKENTELTIEAFRDLEKQEGKTSLGFSMGSVWSKMKKFKDKISRFELEMPSAIAGVHGTVYQSTVNPDSSAEVKVYDGEVAVSGQQEKKPEQPKAPTRLQAPTQVLAPTVVSGPHEISMEEWVKIVKAMQSIKIGANGVPSEPVTFAKSPDDDWERWNEERDKRITEMFSESN